MDSQLIGSLIDDVLDGNATAAKEKFDDALSLKVSNVLDQRKTEIANSLYNDKEHVEQEEQQEEEETEQ